MCHILWHCNEPENYIQMELKFNFSKFSIINHAESIKSLLSYFLYKSLSTILTPANTLSDIVAACYLVRNAAEIKSTIPDGEFHGA